MSSKASISSDLACLALAAKHLNLRVKTQQAQTTDSIHSLKQLESRSYEWGMRPRHLTDWPDVDLALAQLIPVILIGHADAQRAYGKRLGLESKGTSFLFLSTRASALFPASSSPFATETVSYLAHEPRYSNQQVWLCLGELRGFCDAATEEEHLGLALEI